jgi:hypothetical protein
LHGQQADTESKQGKASHLSSPLCRRCAWSYSAFVPGIFLFYFS